MSEEKNCLLKMYLCMMSDDTLTDYLEIHSHRKALVCCLQSVFSDIKIWFVDSIPLFEGFFAPQPHPILFVFFFSFSLFHRAPAAIFFSLSLPVTRVIIRFISNKLVQWHMNAVCASYDWQWNYSISSMSYEVCLQKRERLMQSQRMYMYRV